MKPGESCFICKAKDHIAKNCPQKAQWEKNKICLLCRQRGHSLKNCPIKNDENIDKKLCYNYGETGQSLAKCPHPLQDAIKNEDRPRGQITKFTSGDDLVDNCTVENSASRIQNTSDSKGMSVKSKKKQGPKVVNFVGTLW